MHNWLAEAHGFVVLSNACVKALVSTSVKVYCVNNCE